MRVRRRDLLSVLAATAVAGCGTAPSTPTPTAEEPTPATPAGTVPPPMASDAFTHHRSTGNRVVRGRGDIPNADPLDVPVDTEPTWVAGAAGDERTLWVIAGEAGDLHGFTLADGTATPVPVQPSSLPPGHPPVVIGTDGRISLLTPPPSVSPPSVPLPLGDGTLLFVEGNGTIARWDGDAVVERLELSALPDARLVRAGPDRVVALTGATDRYDHGVLGDPFEADRVTMLTTDGGLSVAWHARPTDRVIEGQAPIVADLSGDGAPDVVVTASGERTGAGIVAFDRDGELAAEGPPIGQGFRWRHQLAVAPFPTDGVPELAVVRTPHIGGRLEFYRWTDGGLSIAATLDGYVSHSIGSRNLDTAVAGDLDGDGLPEIVLPRNDMATLAGVRRTGDGAAEAWTLSVDAPVATNLAAVGRGDGSVVLGVGRSDGTVRFWR